MNEIAKRIDVIENRLKNITRRLEEDFDEIDLGEYIMVLYRRKWFILGFVIICTVLTGIISLLLPKVYRTEFHIEIGRVGGEAIDNYYNLKTRLESEAFLWKIATVINKEPSKYGFESSCEIAPQDIKNLYQIEVIEEGPTSTSKSPIILSVNMFSQEPKALSNLSQLLLQEISVEHKRKFDELLNKNMEWQKLLQEKVEKLKIEVQKKEKAYAKWAAEHPNEENAPLIMQLKTTREALLIHEKELNAWKIKNSYPATFFTRIVDPPYIPLHHYKPNIRLNVLIAFSVSLLFGCILAFFLEFLKKFQMKQYI